MTPKHRALVAMIALQREVPPLCLTRVEELPDDATLDQVKNAVYVAFEEAEDYVRGLGRTVIRSIS